MDLKMYHFKCNSYDNEYTVTAMSAELALIFLKGHLKIKSSKPVDHQAGLNIFVDDYEEWRDATLEKMPKGYTLVEYSVGDVLETEVS